MHSGSGGRSIDTIKVCSLAKTLVAEERWPEFGGIQSIFGTLRQSIVKSRAELSGLALGIEALQHDLQCC